MCLPYSTNSRYESDYECICIMINGKNKQSSFKYFERVESNICALVLLNLINLLRKRDEMLSKPHTLSLFFNLFIKFIKT